MHLNYVYMCIYLCTCIQKCMYIKHKLIWKKVELVSRTRLLLFKLYNSVLFNFQSNYTIYVNVSFSQTTKKDWAVFR